MQHQESILVPPMRTHYGASRGPSQESAPPRRGSPSVGASGQSLPRPAGHAKTPVVRPSAPRQPAFSRARPGTQAKSGRPPGTKVPGHGLSRVTVPHRTSRHGDGACRARCPAQGGRSAAAVVPGRHSLAPSPNSRQGFHAVLGLKSGASGPAGGTSVLGKSGPPAPWGRFPRGPGDLPVNDAVLVTLAVAAVTALCFVIVLLLRRAPGDNP